MCRLRYTCEHTCARAHTHARTHARTHKTFKTSGCDTRINTTRVTHPPAQVTARKHQGDATDPTPARPILVRRRRRGARAQRRRRRLGRPAPARARPRHAMGPLANGCPGPRLDASQLLACIHSTNTTQTKELSFLAEPTRRGSTRHSSLRAPQRSQGAARSRRCVWQPPPHRRRGAPPGRRRPRLDAPAADLSGLCIAGPSGESAAIPKRTRAAHLTRGVGPDAGRVRPTAHSFLYLQHAQFRISNTPISVSTTRPRPREDHRRPHTRVTGARTYESLAPAHTKGTRKGDCRVRRRL